LAAGSTAEPRGHAAAAPDGADLASQRFGIPTAVNITVNVSREEPTHPATFAKDDWRGSGALHAGQRWESERPRPERYNRSIRGLGFSSENPIAARANGNHAKHPIPEIPVNPAEVEGLRARMPGPFPGIAEAAGTAPANPTIPRTNPLKHCAQLSSLRSDVPGSWILEEYGSGT
jgi:hypothetical protein